MAEIFLLIRIFAIYKYIIYFLPGKQDYFYLTF